MNSDPGRSHRRLDSDGQQRQLFSINRLAAWCAAAAFAVAVSFGGQAMAQAAKADEGEQSPDAAHEEVFMEDIYPSAKTCAACHPKQYKEWAVSQHAYAQMSPVYMAMQMAINGLTSGTNGDFCIRCHNQIGMNAGESVFASNLDRPASSREGITCSVCHRVNKSYGKISGRLPLVRGPMHSTIFGPSGDEELQSVIEDTEDKGFRVTTDPGERGLVIHANAEPFFELTQPGFCGTCHDVTLLNGFRLEEAFSEYKQTEAAREGVTCQDCHMGTVQGIPSGYEEGPAAVVDGIPTKDRRVTNHFFAGPDYSLIHPALFPHNVRAAEFAELREWLEYDWKAGWGTEEFEELAELAEEPLDTIDEALVEASDAVKAGEAADASDIQDAIAELEEAMDSEIGAKSGDAYKALMAAADALEGSTDMSAVENAMAAAVHLRVKMGMNFGETWSDSTDREEAREILDENFEQLDWAEEQRYEVMRNGYHLGDIEVASASKNGLSFGIDVINATNGHGIPTGFDAERIVVLQVNVTDSEGNVVYKSGDRDPNGDFRDKHSLYVHNGEIEEDKDLFNLQSKFIVRMFRGGEREQVLAVNRSVSALPFIRPETRATIVYGRPLGARKHKKTIEPLGSKRASYKVPSKSLKDGETYSINIKLIAQMVPVHLIPAIQGAGFDYGMSPKEIADGVVAGAMMLWERETSVTIGGKKQVSLSPSLQRQTAAAAKN